VAAVGAGGKCCYGGDVRGGDEDPPDAGITGPPDVEDAAAAAATDALIMVDVAATALVVVDDAPGVVKLRCCSDCICVSLRATCEGSDGVAAGGVAVVGACCDV
jgi:hypothetical protein